LLAEVVEITPNFFDAAAVAFGVAIIHKVLVAAVRGFEAEGMLNGTPVLAGAVGGGELLYQLKMADERERFALAIGRVDNPED